MEICQFCEMYMKPFFNREKKEMTCEFCGKIIAKVEDGKWIKIAPPPKRYKKYE